MGLRVITGLVSIHDVMPETRRMVMHLLKALHKRVPTLQPAQITLLVVPGKNWSDDDLRWLAGLQSQGYPFAGHGWKHTALTKKTLYHHIHSLILSRDAAEHLSQSSKELQTLVQSCSEWFPNHGFDEPLLYVPPAWAPGCLTLENWQALPFKYLETLGGLRNIASGKYYSLPLCGYESDTRMRAFFLRGFNEYNKLQAESRGKPLRIGLHPSDYKYTLSDAIFEDLCRVDRFIAYDSYFNLEG